MAAEQYHLLAHMPDAFRYGTQSLGSGVSDPTLEVFNGTNERIDWEFNIEGLGTQPEQGILRENIKAAGALHYIQTLGDMAGVFRVTDSIVLQWAMGNLDLPNDPHNPIASQLYRYYKLREDRTSTAERHLLYKRILDTGDVKLGERMIGNKEYPLLWKKMVYEIVRYIQKEEKLDVLSGQVSRKPIYLAVKDLQYNLSTAMAGMALIQAKELYAQFNDCVNILSNTAIVAQKGSGHRRNMWTVLERVSIEEFNTLPNVAALRTVAEEGHRVFKLISKVDDSLLQIGNADFDELKDAVDLFVTAMGERTELENAPDVSGKFAPSSHPLFKNLPGMDNIGNGGDNMFNGMIQDMMQNMQGQNMQGQNM